MQDTINLNKQIKENQVKNVINILFWLGLFITIAADSMIVNFFYNTVARNATFTVSSACLLIKIIYDLIEAKRIDFDCIFSVFAIACGLATYYFSGYFQFLVIVLMILSAKNIDFKIISKMHFVVLISAFLLNLITMALGFKVNRPLDTDDISHIRAVRYCFGCSHPNIFMSLLGIVICSACVVFREKINKVHMGLIFACTLIFFYFTESRSGFLAVLMIIFLLLLGQTKYKQILMKYRFAEIIWGFSVSFMMISGIIFNGRRLIKIRAIKTFTSRIVAWGKALKNIGLSAFGRQINMKYPLDCGFMYIVFAYGILGFIIFTVICVKALRRSREDYYLCVALSGLCILSIFEGTLASVAFSVFLVIAYAENNTSYKEDNMTITGSRLIICNYVLTASVIVLMFGNALISKVTGYDNMISEYIIGPLPVKYDIILMSVGGILGYFVYRTVSKIQENRK